MQDIKRSVKIPFKAILRDTAEIVADREKLNLPVIATFNESTREVVVEEIEKGTPRPVGEHGAHPEE